MVNWTKEDVEFITKSIVVPCFAEFMKEELDLNKNLMDTCEKMINATVDVISKRIRECEYNVYKDRSFLLAFLGQMHGFSQDVLKESYENYCKEYDKLNKHLLKEVEGNE